ncbi:MAG: hypothetical protein Q7R34_02290 [Dehalococcoidia bacterium]|nr:hypothetical protein [Dehalococcoidia bacterium]
MPWKEVSAMALRQEFVNWLYRSRLTLGKCVAVLELAPRRFALLSHDRWYGLHYIGLSNNAKTLPGHVEGIDIPLTQMIDSKLIQTH